MADEPGPRKISPKMRRCMESAADGYTVCTETFRYVLEHRGQLDDSRAIGLLIDCAEICQATHNAFRRSSELARSLATVCTEACEKVAESCLELDESDEQLEACAEACSHCAYCCRELAI